MNFPKELRYMKSHEWAKKEGKKITVGISEYAQKEISDVVFVELPKLDKVVEQGKGAAIVESVKAAFDIYAPMSGKVTKVNTPLESCPELVNQDSYGKGWMFELELSNEAEWNNLLTAEAYEQHVKAGAH